MRAETIVTDVIFLFERFDWQMFALLVQVRKTSQLDLANGGSSASTDTSSGLEMGPIAHVNEPGHTKHTPSSDTFYAVPATTSSVAA